MLGEITIRQPQLILLGALRPATIPADRATRRECGIGPTTARYAAMGASPRRCRRRRMWASTRIAGSHFPRDVPRALADALIEVRQIADRRHGRRSAAGRPPPHIRLARPPTRTRPSPCGNLLLSR